MPQFAYRGRNSRGDLITGRLEAADSGAVADQLLSTGMPVEGHAGGLPAAQYIRTWDHVTFFKTKCLIVPHARPSAGGYPQREGTILLESAYFPV